jgi:hypothetical protein
LLTAPNISSARALCLFETSCCQRRFVSFEARRTGCRQHSRGYDSKRIQAEWVTTRPAEPKLYVRERVKCHCQTRTVTRRVRKRW